MIDTTPHDAPAISRRAELSKSSGPENAPRAAPARARCRPRRRAAAVVLAILMAWIPGSSIPAFAAESTGQDPGTTGALPSSGSAVSAATTLAEGLLATIPPGSRLAVRPFYERETGLPPAEGERLYESVLKAMVRSSADRGITMLARTRLREIYDTLEQFDQGTVVSMLEAAKADIEVICRVFPFKAGVTLSCSATDVKDVVTVAHADARFAMERPVAPLRLAVADIAGQVASGAPETGAIERVTLTDASVGRSSTELAAHVAGLLEVETRRLMAERARREGNDARAAAVLATAPGAGGEAPRYRLTGALWPLDDERLRVDVRLVEHGTTVVAAGADVAVSSLPAILVKGSTAGGSATRTAGRMYEAVAEAVVSARLDRASALRAARNLARARVVSQALGLPPPHVTEVTTEADAVMAFGGLLDAGLPVDERFLRIRPEDESGGEERVAVRLAARVVPLGDLVRPAIGARLDRAVYKAIEEPIRIEIRSEERAYLGVYAWGADNRVVRLYPRAGETLAIGADETLFLPRRSEGRLLTAPLPEPGNREDHEAIVVVAAPQPLDFSTLAAGVGETLSGTMKQAVDGSGFLAALARLDPARMSVTWLPYSVHE